MEAERDVPVPEAADPGVVAQPVRVRGLPGHLPREDVVHGSVSGACTCPDCGGALRPLGIDTHEMLDIVPARWRVVRTLRPKCSGRSCEKFFHAPAPVSGVANGTAIFATMAACRHLRNRPPPAAARPGRDMAARGLDIDRSTLAGWTGQAAALLDPIVSRIRDEALKAENSMPTTRWSRCSTPAAARSRPGGYEFMPLTTRHRAAPCPAQHGIASRDRTAVHPPAHLAGFRGFLQEMPVPAMTGSTGVA